MRHTRDVAEEGADVIDGPDNCRGERVGGEAIQDVKSLGRQEEGQREVDDIRV